MGNCSPGRKIIVLCCLFSRPGRSVQFSPDGRLTSFAQDKKVYVQDLIERDSFRIWDLVDKQKAWVYISGLVALTLGSLMYSFLEQVIQQDAGCRQSGNKERRDVGGQLIGRRSYEIPLSDGVGRPPL
jgi:hypothetical protein